MPISLAYSAPSPQTAGLLLVSANVAGAFKDKPIINVWINAARFLLAHTLKAKPSDIIVATPGTMPKGLLNGYVNRIAVLAVPPLGKDCSTLRHATPTQQVICEWPQPDPIVREFPENMRNLIKDQPSVNVVILADTAQNLFAICPVNLEQSAQMGNAVVLRRPVAQTRAPG